MIVDRADMTCQELVELVTGYLEDALAPADRQRFESHVGECRGCEAHVEQMRVTIATIGSLDPDAIDPRVQQDLLQAFRGWKAGRQE